MNREELAAELVRIIGLGHMSPEWRAERVTDLLVERGIVSHCCYVCGESGAMPAASGSSLPGAAHWECLSGGR